MARRVGEPPSVPIVPPVENEEHPRAQTSSRTTDDDNTTNTSESTSSNTSTSLASEPADHVITIAIDLGTNFSAVKYSIPGKEGAVEDFLMGYPGFQSIRGQANIVPSLLQYDSQKQLINFGWSVDGNVEGQTIVRWFKMALTSDDTGQLSEKAKTQNREFGMDEEMLCIHFLTEVLKVLKLALQYERIHKLAFCIALPTQVDVLAANRYISCLQRAANATEQSVHDIRIFHEIEAVTESTIRKLNLDGTHDLIVVDLGGGTTHVQVAAVTISDERVQEWMEIHTPAYLSIGGEDFDLDLESDLKSSYSTLTTEEHSYLMCLWRDQWKARDYDMWTDVVPAYLKQLMPDFDWLAFQEDIRRRLIEPLLVEMTDYIEDEIEKGLQAREVLNQNEDSMDLGNPATRVLVSGGLANDPRLRRTLQGKLPNMDITFLNNSRTAVVDGLVLLSKDTSRPRFAASYGMRGWIEPEQSNLYDLYDPDLRIKVRAAPSVIISQNSFKSVRRCFKFPCSIREEVGKEPTLPKEIIIYRYTQADLQWWHKAGAFPPQARELFPIVISAATRKKARKYIRKVFYDADDQDPEISYCAIDYVVALMVDTTHFTCQIIIPGDVDQEEDVVLCTTNVTLEKLNLEFDSL